MEKTIKEWFESDTFKQIENGNKYYNNKNEIVNAEKYVINQNGVKEKATNLENNKLPHSFLRKLARQKTNYLLSSEFVVTSQNEKMQELLPKYFNKNFYRTFKNTALDGVITGVGWLQVYYNEEGELKFKRIPSTEIIPFWSDVDKVKLNGVIRVYTSKENVFGEATKYVTYYTTESVKRYHYNSDNKLVFDGYDYDLYVGEDKTGTMWGRIPFIPLKYNAEGIPLLSFIKELIDDYDRRTSGVSNVLAEEPDKIKVVKNYDGTNKQEFIYNLAKYRSLFVREGGDVTTLDTSINTEATEKHLDRLRKDIYEFGFGVDTQNQNLGNASGVALKFIYADLDMDCQSFSVELSAAIEYMLWFIKYDMLLENAGDFFGEDVEITFNINANMNESETITNIKNSVGIVSNKTILSKHPYVTDVTTEEEELEKDIENV